MITNAKTIDRALERINRLLPPEKYFSILSLFFGVIFVFITPAFQVPDEQFHFLHSYQVAEWNFSAQQKDEKWGILIPKSVAKTMGVNQNLIAHPENRIDYTNTFSYLSMRLNAMNRTQVSFLHISPIPHLPQALGMYLGIQLDFSPLILMYCGRITNLLTFILLIYFAIKIIPVFKRFTAFFSLMPMTLFQAASLSYDSLLIASSVLLFAMILRITFSDKRALTKDMAMIILLAIIISVIKVPYYPLVLLYFIIPYQKIGSRKSYFAIFILLFIIPLFVMLIWKLSMAGLHLMPPSTGGTDIIPTKQMGYLFTQSFVFMPAIPGTILKNVYFYPQSFIGILGWLDTRLPKWFYFFYTFFLLFFSITDSNKNISVNITKKCIFAFVFSLIFLLIAKIMFLIYTQPGSSTIEGIQGRYFIPICLLPFLLFYNQKCGRIGFINHNMLSVLVIIVSLFITIITLLKRYYIPLS